MNNTIEKQYAMSMSSSAFCYDGEGLCGWFVNDGERKKKSMKRAESHVKLGDYFGTLATILFLIEQEKKGLEEKHNAFLRTLKDELVYLQENYKIEKKSSDRR